MAEANDRVPYPQASLGVVSTGEGLRRVDGTKAGEMPRGCPACNRDSGRPSTSQTCNVELPLEGEGDGAEPEKVAVEIAIDYCPRCGRVYDVRAIAAY